jgi:predicted Kef-type K+ transport protein
MTCVVEKEKLCFVDLKEDSVRHGFLVVEDIVLAVLLVIVLAVAPVAVSVSVCNSEVKDKNETLQTKP